MRSLGDAKQFDTLKSDVEKLKSDQPQDITWNSVRDTNPRPTTRIIFTHSVNIEKMENITLTKEVDEQLNGSECYICRGSPYRLGERVVKLACQCPHWLHQGCLSTATIDGRCPTCRVALISLDPESIFLDAASKGDLPKILELLSNGMPHSPRGAFKETPLMLAAKGGHQQVAEELCQKGALFSDRDDSGRTPLFYAVIGGQREMVIWLLDKGADLTALDEKGRSLLHYAITYGTGLEFIKLLLDRGADCSSPDRDLNSPLDLAERDQNLALSDLLRGYGATPGVIALLKWHEERCKKG